MDKIASRLDEYGSINVSSPLLVPAVGDKIESPFALNLNMSGKEYFDKASADIEGKASILDEMQVSLSGNLQGQVDPAGAAQYADAMRRYSASEAMRSRANDLMLKSAQAAYEAALAKISPDESEASKLEKKAAALKDYSNAISAAAGPATFPTYDAKNLPAAGATVTTAAKDAFSNNGVFREIRGLLSDKSKPVVRSRSAIITAAGDIATQGIFSVLGDPAKYVAFQDKKIMFGAAMVSVQPGWRTKDDYSADVAVTVSYEYVPARIELVRDAYQTAKRQLGGKGITQGAVKFRNAEAVCNLIKNWAGESAVNVWDSEITVKTTNTLCDLTVAKIMGSIDRPRSALGNQGYSKSTDALSPVVIPQELLAKPHSCSPLVAAVSPMTDVQTLDLSSSLRQRYETALRLSLALTEAGNKAAGDVFTSYAKNIQRDVETRNAIPVVASYSNSGGLFGFQIGPRLQAMESGADTSAKPSMCLDRQCFPVLIMVGMDADDVGLRFRSVGGRIEPVEPVVKFTQSSRWIPVTESRIGKRIYRIIGGIRGVKQMANCFGWRIGEAERLEWANDIEDMIAELPPSAAEWTEDIHCLAVATAAITSGKDTEANLQEVRGRLESIENAVELAQRMGLVDKSEYNEAKADLTRATVELMSKESMKDTKNSTTKLSDLFKNGSNSRCCSDELTEIKNLLNLAFENAKNLNALGDRLSDTVRNRLQMLRTQAVASSNFQSIPLEFYSLWKDTGKDSPKTETPRLTGMYPQSISCLPGDSISSQTLLIITGVNLDSDCTVEPDCGNATVVAHSANSLVVRYSLPMKMNKPATVVFKVTQKENVMTWPLAIVSSEVNVRRNNDEYRGSSEDLVKTMIQSQKGPERPAKYEANIRVTAP